jgi:dephospho-CoA kinase
MEKLIIGIIGKNGSGKDSIGDHVVSHYGAQKLVFSDMLKEALGIFMEEKDIGRTDMAWLATLLRDKYGQGVLVQGMKKRVLASDARISVLSGIRDFGELEMVRSFTKNIVIYVQADQEIRWGRLKKRQSKSDDQVSFEDFLARENLDTEKMIEALSSKADYVLDNNSGVGILLSQVDDIVKKALT